MELGYAVKALGWRRVLMVQNVAFGGPELLPFDLRQKRAIRYSSPADASARASERRALASSLETALHEIFKEPVQRAPGIDVKLDYRMTERGPGKRGDYHGYELIATLQNVGTKRIDDWELEVEFPSPYIRAAGVVIGALVADRSNAETSLIRVRGEDLGRRLSPGDSYKVTFAYVVNQELYEHYRNAFDTQKIVLRASDDGHLVSALERPFRELQNF